MSNSHTLRHGGISPMVYRILKIINRILFGLMTLAFLVCLAYTLTAPVVQASMQQAQQSAEQIAATATDAIQAELTRQTDDALSGVRSSLDGVGQALAGIWATFTAPDGTVQGSAFSLSGSNDQPTYSGLAS